MIDPRLNDKGLSEPERARLAHVAGMIAADHPQLWTDSDLQRAASRNGPASERDALRDARMIAADTGRALDVLATTPRVSGARARVVLVLVDDARLPARLRTHTLVVDARMLARRGIDVDRRVRALYPDLVVRRYPGARAPASS